MDNRYETIKQNTRVRLTFFFPKQIDLNYVLSGVNRLNRFQLYSNLVFYLENVCMELEEKCEIIYFINNLENCLCGRI